MVEKFETSIKLNNLRAMDKLIENYRELFRTMNRLHNTNKGLLLKGDIERLERAREILNNQPSEERRIVPSDDNSGLHKHGVNASALLNDAMNWWANECFHKDFDKLTRNEKRTIKPQFKIMRLYVEFLHSR